MKAVTAALTKKAVSNAKGRSLFKAVVVNKPKYGEIRSSVCNTCSQQFAQGPSLKPKINITYFIKSKMMLENFGADENARFSPTLVVGLIQLTRVQNLVKKNF